MSDRAEWMDDADRMWFGDSLTVAEIVEGTGRPLEEVQQYLAEATYQFVKAVYDRRLRGGGFL